MGVYPVMYALLDIERTIRGLPELEAIEFYDDIKGVGGYFYWSDELKHRPVQDLARNLKTYLNWLNEIVSMGEKSSRAIAFVLGNSDLAQENITVTIAAEYQLCLPETQRSRYVLADVSFSGEKWESTLPIENPLYPIVLAFLKAIQPVHAFVIGDSYSPSQDKEFFRQQWRHVSSSTFLGPELVEIIPFDLLSQEAGFAHLERLGDGVWITVPRGIQTLEQDVEGDRISNQHDLACFAVERFLKTVSNFLARERE